MAYAKGCDWIGMNNTCRGTRKVHVFIEIRSDTGKLCGVYKSMNL